MGVDLPQVVVARKDTNPAGKPTKVAAFGSVTVILRDVHRVQGDAILPVSAQNFICGFLEGRQPVVHRTTGFTQPIVSGPRILSCPLSRLLGAHSHAIDEYRMRRLADELLNRSALQVADALPELRGRKLPTTTDHLQIGLVGVADDVQFETNPAG
ncbi:MAG: hypothetical protein WCE63_24180 [Acidobacteriaceae bacterium]